MSYEVENKFRIEDMTGVELKLVGLGCEFGPEVTQRDRYFAHPARDFGKTDEALRIRSVGDENRVTYKGPKIDAATKTRLEIEPLLGPGAGNAEQMAEVLVALGFRAVRVVEKQRRTAQMVWQGVAVEAALDRIEGLGSFLELEATAEEGQLDEARGCLLALAEELELGPPERRSYLEMLLSAG